MSTDQTSAPSGERAPGRIDAEVWTIVTVLILGSIMTVLDTTIVNIACIAVPRFSYHAEGRRSGW